jgi:peptide deformylase
MKPIVVVPQTVLVSPASTVTKFDAKLAAIIADMEETLLATTNPKGVGLAAPQIGLGLRIFITKPTPKAAIRAFINPKIISSSRDKTNGVPERENKLEGCLSIPNVWGKVKRTVSLRLSYQDLKGMPHEEEFTGFLATIIQHETDHTNGILFTQRVLEQKGKLYQIGTDDEGEELLEEIPLQ